MLLKAGEATHELRLTTNALCWLEEVSGKSVGQALQSLGDGSVRMTDLRLLVCAAAGLKDPAAAGDLIDAAGLAATIEALGAAVAAAFPEADEESGKKRTAAA